MRLLRCMLGILLLCCGHLSLGTTAPPFYMYTGPEFEWDYLRPCVRGYMDPHTMLRDDMELMFAQQLRASAYRVTDISLAILFVIPIAMSLSVRAGHCNGTNHMERMTTMAHALDKSTHFHRSKGNDHVLLCTDWAINYGGGKYNRKNKHWILGWKVPSSMANISLGHYTIFSHRPAARCYVAVPYLANGNCAQLRQDASNAKRTINFYFRGSLNNSCGNMRQHMTRVHRNDSLVIHTQRVGLGFAHGHFSAQEYAVQMVKSRFCLIFSGDVPTSSRLFDAIACGCIPVFVSRHLNWDLPFRDHVDWDTTVVRISEEAFAHDPDQALQHALNRNSESLEMMQQRLEVLRQAVDWWHPKSSVAENFLATVVSKCMRGCDSAHGVCCRSYPHTCTGKGEMHFEFANGTRCNPDLHKDCRPELHPGECTLT
eukprot:NODE_2661_length_1369_cov_19.888443_g2529_i0.p1 GENE.NODE_2661_length_1369_cov_19.888443_g2529_i0~~NODE_2661_length_1369_cov_19.888443_g2529_i0.p1  ORF type:complete len:428 (+),score=27.58 NODE_2661_length_1369_cov_19.888443_g2529_i0:73-1356(+)